MYQTIPFPLPYLSALFSTPEPTRYTFKSPLHSILQTYSRISLSRPTRDMMRLRNGDEANLGKAHPLTSPLIYILAKNVKLYNKS